MRKRWSALLPALCGILAVSACSRPSPPNPPGESRAAAAQPVARAQAGQEEEKPDGADAKPSDEFRFPADAAGALAEKRLRPGLPATPERTTEPRRRPATPSVEEPQPPLPPTVVVAVPQLPPEPSTKRSAPHLNLEET